MIQFRNSRTGEVVNVNADDAENYRRADGWRKVKDGVARPRHGAAKRVRGRWRIDREEVRKQSIRGMSRVELFDHFTGIIAKLEARVAELEKRNG